VNVTQAIVLGFVQGITELQLIGGALVVLGLVLMYAEHVLTRVRSIESPTPLAKTGSIS
jgi:undecaprenyl pyrophosphate phosphatase UppP